MSNFGKKISELRKDKKISQAELAKKLKTSVSVIGRYERGEMTPSIDAAVKIALVLDTTVGYLLGETDQVNLLRDSTMLNRLNDLERFPQKDKECIIYALDAMIRDTKTRIAYA